MWGSVVSAWCASVGLRGGRVGVGVLEGFRCRSCIVGYEGGTWPNRINALAAYCDESHLFLGADDVRFWPNWLSAALSAEHADDGIVVTEDLYNPRGTLALVSRAYLNEFNGGTFNYDGGVIHPGYRHNYAETELFDLAESRGRRSTALGSIVEHLHPAAKKAEDDEVYRLGISSLDEDKALYFSRFSEWKAGAYARSGA